MATNVNANAPWLFERPDGWYHSDETDDLIGPFETEEEASAALDQHVLWLVSESRPYNPTHDPTEYE